MFLERCISLASVCTHSAANIIPQETGGAKMLRSKTMISYISQVMAIVIGESEYDTMIQMP